MAVAGCGRAATTAPAPATSTAAASPLNGTPRCTPAPRGFLKARLQGSIDAELDWSAGVQQCVGGVRPSGDGVRLLYQGSDAGGQSLLIVLGAGPLREGESARNVPVNLTVVREGAGQFFATQGDDKCAFDSVSQEPVAGRPGQFLLSGRGYCTQPARSVGTEGSVLVSRFDVEAIVDYRQ